MSQTPTFASPKRNVAVPSDTPCSPPFRDHTLYPWNWAFGAQQIALSPVSSCGSPETDTDREAKLRRGRPRSDKISSLILEGTQTASSIRCKICERVFPREKSLQAHLRTHTGKYNYYYYNKKNVLKTSSSGSRVRDLD